YAIGGLYYSGFSTGNDDFILIKLDSLGNLIWSNKIGGGAPEHCYDMKLTNDGGFILCGETNLAITCGFIAKFDSIENLQWSNVYRNDNFFFGGSSIIQSNDGNYFACGYWDIYDYGVFKLDS